MIQRLIRLIEMVTREYPDILKDEEEIADYISSLATEEVDEELIREYFIGTHAVLKWVDVDSIREGDSDHHISDEEKELEYKYMDSSTMPPIVIEDGKIMDGNHRYRVAKAKGLEKIRAYIVKD